MSDNDTQRAAISPDLSHESPDAVRARQGVVSFRIVTILVVSTVLAAVAMAVAYLFF